MLESSRDQRARDLLDIQVWFECFIHSSTRLSSSVFTVETVKAICSLNLYRIFLWTNWVALSGHEKNSFSKVYCLLDAIKRALGCLSWQEGSEVRFVVFLNFMWKGRFQEHLFSRHGVVWMRLQENFKGAETPLSISEVSCIHLASQRKVDSFKKMTLCMLLFGS